MVAKHDCFSFSLITLSFGKHFSTNHEMEHAERRNRYIPFLALAPILGTFYYYPKWRRKKQYRGVNIFYIVEIKDRTYIVINVQNSNYFELNILNFEFYKFGFHQTTLFLELKENVRNEDWAKD